MLMSDLALSISHIKEYRNVLKSYYITENITSMAYLGVLHSPCRLDAGHLLKPKLQNHNSLIKKLLGGENFTLLLTFEKINMIVKVGVIT